MVETTNFAALIPELSDWNEGRGIAPDDWISCVGNYELAVGYSLIFWPNFTEFETYILRADFEESSLRGFEKMTKGNRVAVEAVMNHVHIADIHPNVTCSSDEQLRYLGRTPKNIYILKLHAEFPGRRFNVTFNDEPGLEAIDYELTFFQK